ncbi:hypothetical protein NP233_g1760 [Leucocoprinus birnbaumii]|uniref:NACHT domain-containing protein n=1 Tax=Leucocoprinus birnbaumii TaxID=56174 RepID=A0AAD5YXQ9_9AGAR|nr:hypothetical protein NP233_g1760 [Leucocoprinus birnbaumii]
MPWREKFGRAKLVILGRSKQMQTVASASVSSHAPQRTATYGAQPAFVILPGDTGSSTRVHQLHQLEGKPRISEYSPSPTQSSQSRSNTPFSEREWLCAGTIIDDNKPLPPLPPANADVPCCTLNPCQYNGSRTNLQTGAFANAHHFTIGSAYLNDLPFEEDMAARKERIGRKVLERLATKGMPSAMLESKERTYAPRCNEDTRKTLRTRILKWSRKENDSKRLLWLSGPAGVGKSAVAQTVAEELKDEGCLGAVFFFSRPNDRSDPDVVIPTLVYQLSLLLPEYKDLIISQFEKDPIIFDKNRRTQFQELIVEPFRDLHCLAKLKQTLMIILDGLDECNDREAQLEFVNMITRYIRTERNLRVRWMVCSRPEPDLMRAFLSADCRAICHEEKLEVDDIEAQADALRILQGGFTEIRERYPDQLPEDWPDQSKVRLIACRSSGHLGFVSFIIRFIGDKHYDDPSGQLDVCLRFLDGVKSPEDLNPLHALDLLYTQIFSSVPKNDLPIARRILGTLVLYGSESLTALVHLNFLGLDQTTFYRALQRLHSVLFIPPATKSASNPIQIYHASFSDYLRDSTRSGPFVLDEEAIHFDVAMRGLAWLSYRCRNPSDHREKLAEPSWVPKKLERITVIDSVCNFAFTPCWKACPLVSESSRMVLFNALKTFDFDLQYMRWKDQTREFAHFIRWLTSLGPQYKRFIVIDNFYEGNVNDRWNKGEVAIWHYDRNPQGFVAPFGGSASHSERYSMHLRIRTHNFTSFWLAVSTSYHPYFEY